MSESEQAAPTYAIELPTISPAQALPPAPEPPSQSPSDTGDPVSGDLGIGLWGAPLSGKTNFVHALQVAIEQFNADSAEEKWNLRGRDAATEGFLAEGRRRLEGDTHLAPATANPEKLLCTLSGRLRAGRRGVEAVRFDFEIRDVPGGHFLDPFSADEGGTSGIRPAPELADESIRFLAQARGLIYLFDLTRELGPGDSSVRFFDHTVDRIRHLVPDYQRDGVLLPHFLAVCVTKFDSAEVFRCANQAGLVETGPDGRLRVPDEDAKKFFERLADDENHPSASSVRRLINGNFDRERVEYFVSSALGFSDGPRRRGAARSGESDQELGIARQPNPLAYQDGSRALRAAQPINVLEPVLWLVDKIWATQKASPR